MRHPYVFRTLPQVTPFVAADRLLRFGVIAMNPCAYHFARKEKGGPAILQAKPQLPGYFVGMFDVTKLWQISQARVIGRPLSSDGHVRPLDWHIWHDIMDLNSYAQEAPEIVMGGGLRPGMHVLLKDGPHAGKRLRVESATKNGRRATALLEFLGALREVHIDADKVEVEALSA